MPAKPQLSKLSSEALRHLAGDRAFERGEEYAANERVTALAEDRGRITAIVRGTHRYVARLWTERKALRYACSCPVGDDGICCKHCVALGLVWLDGQRPDSATARTPSLSPSTSQLPGRRPARRSPTMRDVRAHLSAKTKNALVELIVQHAMEDERWREQLLLETAQSSAHGVNLDAYREAISNATETGEFVDYYEAHGYFSRLDEVLASVAKLLKQGHAEAVVALTEHFLECLEQAAGQVDDSDGGTTEIMERLHDLHLKACKAERPDPVALARRLFAWEMRSDYEVFYGAVRRYAKLFGAEGLAAYRELANTEWARVPVLKPGQDAFRRSGNRFRITSIMEALAELSGDLEAQVAVRERDLSSAYNYLQIAELYQKSGQRDRALDWAEQGVKAFPKQTDSRLREFLARQYQRLKRNDECMALIWLTFAEYPSLDGYQTLHRYAKPMGQWPSWRAKAVEAVRITDGAGNNAAARAKNPWAARKDGSLLVQILLWEKNVDDAWREAERAGCSSALWLELARLRETDHPLDAARVYREQVDHVVSQGNNLAYAEGVALMRRAARAMKQGGKGTEVAAYVAGVRERFKAKRNFVKLVDAARW